MTRFPAVLCAPLLLASACSAARQSPTIPPAATVKIASPAPRRVLSLDGIWQIQQGTLDEIPKEFPAAVSVPGLVDMSKPAFQDVGKKSPLRQAFWYRRTFVVDGPLPALALLKIHKARYGTKVFINGQSAGEHLPCFTPAFLDVHTLLKGGGQENVLLVRVGADRDSMPQGMPTGWDSEKYLFIPGIYDSVELILTGTPFIRNVQVVPDVESKTVRLVAGVVVGEKGRDGFPLAAKVTPASSPGSLVAQGVTAQWPARSVAEVSCEMTLPIPDCRLWSPEDPFLYEALLATGADAVKVRFGMRSFRFDPQTKSAILNGKPYFMRGTNVCIYRFLEDAQRSDLPWNPHWVRRLHEKFKTMHWNSMRYCIGFPPERWYDIADEVGFLIQDEFPIWLSGRTAEKLAVEKLIPEYTEWMRERWNHPSVVIWDAQNESFTKETGKAIQAVRHLDLSNRPWDNGWSEPQAPTDCVESHPYQFISIWQNKKPFKMKDMAQLSGVPPVQVAQRKTPMPILINEYAWLWLTRDGHPTCLTGKVYETLLGPNSTVDQRRRLCARFLAAKTEFWRCHRECAGVLHFCGLGYSRPGDKPRPEGGATSDPFMDVGNLTFEPHFEEYVREAFNPVGLMLDFWDEQWSCGQKREFKVYVINDLYQDWSGDVTLTVQQGDRIVHEKPLPCKVPALGREILTFEVSAPAEPGDCAIQAELKDPAGRRVRSRREFKAMRESDGR